MHIHGVRLWGVFLVGILVTGVSAMATEKPKYALLLKSGDFELRDYAPYVVAETTVDQATFDSAGTEGFKRLAGYIFGGNQGAQKIAMTAPVQMQPDAKGDRLAMTSPVTTQTTGAGRLVVAFMMPSAYSVTDLPRPNDSRVSFRQVPPRRLAVVRFSGGWSEERFKDKESALLSWAVDRKWRTLGRPFSARYNPPFWPTFLRRNEIQVEVQAPEFPPSLPKQWVQD